jgi:hypothetical protein
MSSNRSLSRSGNGAAASILPLERSCTKRRDLTGAKARGDLSPKKNDEMGNQESHEERVIDGSAELKPRFAASKSSRSSMPNLSAVRVLSLEAVMAEAGAILWPDIGDEQSDKSS